MSLYPKPNRNRHADVLVLGGNLTGLMAAYILQKHNRTVLLCDAGEIGAAFPEFLRWTETVFGEEERSKDKIRARSGAIQTVREAADACARPLTLSDAFLCSEDRNAENTFSLLGGSFRASGLSGRTVSGETSPLSGYAGFLARDAGLCYEPHTFAQGLCDLLAIRGAEIFERTVVEEILPTRTGICAFTESGHRLTASFLVDTTFPASVPLASRKRKIAYSGVSASVRKQPLIFQEDEKNGICGVLDGFRSMVRRNVCSAFGKTSPVREFQQTAATRRAEKHLKTKMTETNGLLCKKEPASGGTALARDGSRWYMLSTLGCPLLDSVVLAEDLLSLQHGGTSVFPLFRL